MAEFEIPRWVVTTVKVGSAIAVLNVIHSSFVAPQEELAVPAVVTEEGVMKVDVVKTALNSGSGAWFSLGQVGVFFDTLFDPDAQVEGQQNPYSTNQGLEQSAEITPNPPAPPMPAGALPGMGCRYDPRQPGNGWHRVEDGVLGECLVDMPEDNGTEVSIMPEPGVATEVVIPAGQ